MFVLVGEPTNPKTFRRKDKGGQEAERNNIYSGNKVMYCGLSSVFYELTLAIRITLGN